MVSEVMRWLPEYVLGNTLIAEGSPHRIQLDHRSVRSKHREKNEIQYAALKGMQWRLTPVIQDRHAMSNVEACHAGFTVHCGSNPVAATLRLSHELAGYSVVC